MDLIAQAKVVFNKLGIKPSSNAKSHDVITSLEDLEECFSYYFKKCAAAERFVTSFEVFHKIVDAAKKSPQVQVHTYFVLFKASYFFVSRYTTS